MSGTVRVRYVMDHLNHDDLVGEPLLPEAPVDGEAYGRRNESWDRVLRLTGGTLSGGLAAVSFTALPGGGYQVEGGGWFYARPLGGGLALRCTLGNAQPQIEDNNGSGARDIIDTVNGDARYLARAGGELFGPLQLPNGTLAVPSLALGAADGTGLSRSANAIVLGIQGSMVLGFFAGSWQSYATLSLLGNRITQLGDATAAGDALNQRSGDARYLTRAGGQLTGTLTTQPGTGQNDLGIGIGDINTGLYRNGPGAGADLMFLAVGYPLLMLTASREAIINGPLSVGMNRVMQVGDATVDTDALNGRVGDARYGRASSYVVDLPGNVTFTTAVFVNLMPLTFAIPRGGNSRISVRLLLDCQLPGDSQIGIIGVRCSSAPAKVSKQFLYQLNGHCNGVVAEFVFDVAGTSVGPFDVQCANLTVGPPAGGAISFNVLAGSQAVVEDMGPR
jgi:hypothetical protein